MNVAPEKIPWEAMKSLISQSVYGGKIDNEFDDKILKSLVNQFFSPNCFDISFPLFTAPKGSDVEPLAIPDAKNMK